MSVSVQIDDFDVGAEINALRNGRADIGAIVSFVGCVRDMAQGESISAMHLEHYPGMTENALAEIAQDATQRWSLQDCRIIHRYGELNAGAQIVLVLTAAPHRQDAFLSAEFIMDFLKSRAPFWKKEITDGGGRWVDARDQDETALSRWKR